MQRETFYYNNQWTRNFLIATIAWGVIALLVGLTIALQLVFPDLNLDTSWFTFGRLRALHTNGAIFAFVGNSIFAGVYYSLPRLLKTPMASNLLSKIHFWGWQLIILAAVISLPLGLTSSKEYAELEWPIDIAIALIWVTFGVNMFWTIIKRRERHLYVAIWFYIATFVTVAMLHIVNSIEIPVSFMKSYSAFAGVQDALVQWWYGHNAVAFFLTTPVLGMMYYFVPKAANRPVYSYRLSIVHFWALIFLYIWAGPHHLLYTALPDWAQSLGTVFSIMLIFPSWGGMINGLLTLRGAWDKVRDSAVLKFFVVALTCYGMATLEGPLLSLRNINAIAHYTDWIPAHVHIGTLGWNGFMIFGVVYWLLPKLYQTSLYSEKLANTHFWIGTLGIIFWALPMYVAGFTQSLMWKEFNPDGTLVYFNFLETVTRIIPMYKLRALGGGLYIIGMLIMVVNVMRTAGSGKFLRTEEDSAVPFGKVFEKPRGEHWHRWIERRPIQLMVWSLVVVAIGGILEIVPTMMVKSNIPTIESVKPYTVLELEGRDIYIREGCNACHSQMVRPFRSEVARYGEYSKAGEFVYDHPFLWGSKRTGPDLHRVGGKYQHQWHYKHMLNPINTSDKSIMPRYPWLFENTLDTQYTQKKLEVMAGLGVPYEQDYIDNYEFYLTQQQEAITNELREQIEDLEIKRDDEIVALIAYLQRLGVDIKAQETKLAEED
ncbi:cytochrome c oxidase, cbb3-type, subunit I/cytochrome c oxidase, cbb3-type, subunit II [Owenweeksia hongkongensis DSM 17368]|uniref:cytochrome-c oxidase n=1 Tax=Owenweeksia hongkongensis (strain DSM 17368 / CIP 108786 / JCM 12287 / NRRL B-23963 / UST20020801) TaxID=926562 RepID=G8R3K4_OWEHD|nr:cytochrome-c oxidase, cbb3-type subunit I [Owenweeksia hongkongensis]AEV33060.1 cytochrome c oxidase, cbb3-type, subunit I/cytochrome c oxidase, cbb3-type, subunit II [Owenweeksia hongkongensis DSM 17368]